MKRMLILLTLVLSIGSTAAVAQDELPVERKSTEEIEAQGEKATEGAAFTSPLHDLDWMVGLWVDQGEATTITTECSWTHRGKFLSRSFKITTSGEATLEGTQVIGWDPTKGQIRSWTFDSEGGFGSGRWIRDGNRWMVKTSFVLASGERASAINIITYVDQDTFRWQSTNRDIAGEFQPNISEVTVVRQNVEHNTSMRSLQEDSQ